MMKLKAIRINNNLSDPSSVFEPITTRDEACIGRYLSFVSNILIPEPIIVIIIVNWHLVRICDVIRGLDIIYFGVGLRSEIDQASLHGRVQLEL